MAGDAYILAKWPVAARPANPRNSDRAKQSQSQASRETSYGVTTNGINGTKQSQLLEDGQQGAGSRRTDFAKQDACDKSRVVTGLA